MNTTDHEHTLNVQLAKLLKEYHGLNAKAEQLHKNRRGRIDVEVKIGRVNIAVEAEHGWNSTKEKSAVKDADKRLENPFSVDCAVAVCYPDNSTPISLQDSKYKWMVRYKEKRNNTDGWNEGNLYQLASVIRLTPAQLGDPDKIADSLSSILDNAVRRLDERQKELLAKSLDLPSVQQRSGTSWNQAAKRSMLVLATAMMFHSRLDDSLAEMKPEQDNRYSPPIAFNDSWPPNTVQNCIASDNPVIEFSKAWDLILALDYKPIFATGKAVISSCAVAPNFNDAIKQAAEVAFKIAGNIEGLRHDLLGRIFHTVLNTARYDGSFYTTTSAATLLSNLAIKPDMCDWNDIENLGKFRITDPACGTGTLLMAASDRIRDVANLEENEEVAKTLIEQTISGYDVNLSATHMAATTLGLLSPQTQFRKMKIARVLLGIKEGKAYMGSLEFLDQNQLLMPWPNQLQSTEQVESGEELSAENNSVDVVIMNPPFTRDSLRHDQFSNSEERLLKQREKKIFNNSPVDLSGNSSGFIVLAEYLNKKSIGATLAAVLPAVTTTNKSSLAIRQFLATHYHIEVVVVSHDPERIFFSENTGIAEMLLVCRRWNKKNSKPPTKIVNLAVNPETPTEAFMVAEGINQGSIKDGTIQECPADKMAGGDWSGVQFLSPYLCDQFARLENSELFDATEMKNVSEIGPAGRRIHDAFNKKEYAGKEGMTALWYHKTKDTQSIQASKTMKACTDTYITPKEDKRNLALSYWEQRSRLLLPSRISPNCVRTVSVYLDNKTLGAGPWVPCKPNIENIEKNINAENEIIKIEKVLCVYLNSIIGILALLGIRTNKFLSYPKFSLYNLRKISVPDFSALVGGGRVIDELARVFDEQSNNSLLPLPDMKDDPVRKTLDKAVIKVLDIDPETVEKIRNELSKEPIITGRRYEK